MDKNIVTIKDWLKRWGILPLIMIVMLTIFQQIVEKFAEPSINILFNTTATNAESIDYYWIAPILTVVVVGIVMAWYLNKVNKKSAQCKIYCKFLFDKRNALRTELDDCKDKLNRIYESNPALNPTRTIGLQASILLRPSTSDDDMLMEIHRWLHES